MARVPMRRAAQAGVGLLLAVLLGSGCATVRRARDAQHGAGRRRASGPLTAAELGLSSTPC